MLKRIILFTVMIMSVSLLPETRQQRPVRVIDIFTNYPSSNEVLKELNSLRRRRQDEEFNVSARSFHDYDDYNDRYRPSYADYMHRDYYGDRNDNRADILESEFGVFEDSQSNYASDYNDRYVYLQGQKFNDYVPQDYAASQEGSDKLDKFVDNRPNFQTKRNYSYDQLNFDNKLPAYFQDVQSDFGDFISSTVKPVRKRKPIQKKNKPKPNLGIDAVVVTGTTHDANKAANETRQRVTNILRKYLVKMHKKKDPNGHRADRKQHMKNKDRTVSFQSIGSLADNKKTQIVTDYKLEPHQRYITQPLEHLKNKTLKFANKFLSLFTVIQFPNDKCQATSALSDYEGTCYLQSECDALYGTAMGFCADGHGVCCVFRGTCGGVGSCNCTYFESPGYPNYFPNGGGVVTPQPETTANPNTPDPRLTFILVNAEGRAVSEESDALSCIYRVYKTNNDIKQMRIDFIDLELRGPIDGECVDERLVISGSGLNTMVPIICGYNSGQHVYVDVSTLSGALQLAVLANSIQRKRYKLKICQYSDGCSGSMNCLQYYTGISGTITSFNYEQAASFNRSTPGYTNNLNYAICIRREPGYCTITYTVVGPNGVTYPFQLRNFDDDGLPTVPNGQAGVGVINCPDDYIVINGIRLCGDRLNDGSVNDNFAVNAPVTDFSGGPIVIPVRTSSSQTGRGFKLFYMQNRCTSSTGGVPDPRFRAAAP